MRGAIVSEMLAISGSDLNLSGHRLDRSRPMRAQIYEIVRNLILTGELAAGDAIDEKAIAGMLGVSRTPVREALKKLGDEHLVEIKAQSGTLVSRIDRRQIHEAFLIRRALEVECTGLAAERMTPGHSNRLEDIHLLHALAIERRRYAEAIGFDDDFHRTIAEISDLPGLWRVVDISKAQLDRCRHLTIPKPGHAEATLAQHRAIIAALVTRDVARSRQMMSEHLESAYRGIVAFLDHTESAQR